MKAVAATQFLLFASVLVVLYLVWMQGGQLAMLESDVDTIRRQMSDLAKPAEASKRTTTRATRNPKETTK